MYAEPLYEECEAGRRRGRGVNRLYGVGFGPARSASKLPSRRDG